MVGSPAGVSVFGGEPGIPESPVVAHLVGELGFGGAIETEDRLFFPVGDEPQGFWLHREVFDTASHWDRGEEPPDRLIISQRGVQPTSWPLEVPPPT